MCQLMAIEMGVLDAIVKRKDESVDAHTLADETNREELLIGSSHSIFQIERQLMVFSTHHEAVDCSWLLRRDRRATISLKCECAVVEHSWYGRRHAQHVSIFMRSRTLVTRERHLKRTSGLNSCTPSVGLSSLCFGRQKQQGARRPIFKPLTDTHMGLHCSNISNETPSTSYTLTTGCLDEEPVSGANGSISILSNLDWLQDPIEKTMPFSWSTWQGARVTISLA